MSAIKLLIIEDDPVIVQLLKSELDALQSDVAFEYVEAGRLSAARGVLEGNGIDAVLFDLGLPDNYGLEGVAALTEEFPGVAIIVFTGHAVLDDAVQAIRLGAQDYFTKPVQINEVGRLAWAIRLAVARQRYRTRAVNASSARWKSIALMLSGIAAILTALLSWVAFFKSK